MTYASYQEAASLEEPDPAAYGTWVPGIPVLIENGLEAVHCAPWLQGLILDGIVAGVGAVLGFVPQMLVLFLLLAFLESCGYMARIAFVMDRIFRKFGLSGKSFIPMLIGTGCGVPGVMASRTIENDRDRKMTIMTTTFIPCGAKLPIIALIAGALFGGAWWVAPSAYFVGIAAIIISGIMLKKTKMFAGDPAPFVMELPAYHLADGGQRAPFACGNAAGPLSKRPEPSSCWPPFLFGSPLTSAWRADGFGMVDDERSASWRPSATALPGSLSPWVGATGRARWRPSLV